MGFYLNKVKINSILTANFFRINMSIARSLLSLKAEVPAVGAIISRQYHVKVIDHYENPRNVGTLNKKSKTVGTGLVGVPACGDVMRLQIKLTMTEKLSMQNSKLLDVVPPLPPAPLQLSGSRE